MHKIVKIADGNVEPTVYIEGDNCDRIDDARSQYPIVKVFIGEKVIVYKGFPYELEVDGIGSRGYNQ